MRVVVIMVNDFPAHVVELSTARSEELVINDLIIAQQRAQLDKFERMYPGEKPQDYPIVLGFVHAYAFELEKAK